MTQGNNHTDSAQVFLSMFICGLKLLELQYLCPVLYPKGIVCSLTQSQYLEVGKNSLAYSFSIKWKKMQLNQFLKLESNQVQMLIILLLHRSRANQKTKRDTKNSYVQHSFLECFIESLSICWAREQSAYLSYFQWKEIHSLTCQCLLSTWDALVLCVKLHILSSLYMIPSWWWSCIHNFST